MGSLVLLETTDEGVGNGESLGSRFGTGDPGELSLSANRNDMTCRLGTIESSKTGIVVKGGQCTRGSVADVGRHKCIAWVVALGRSVVAQRSMLYE